MSESKLSPVEGIKETSRQLRGSIAQELSAQSDHFEGGDKNLLKFHGTYQQEDRDARKNRDKSGVGKHFMFMVRCRIPGGKVTADQYLALDDLAGRFANGTLRLTSRQGVQLHGVLKGNLKATIAGINHCLLTTLGACGDVERNVMACPAPLADPVRNELQRQADLIAEHLAPKTTAYHEIWLNGEKQHAVEVDEPIYGKTYLPRKFKTGLSLPHDNCIDAFAQDLAFLADVRGGRLVGYDVLVGGGMGMSHGNAKTFPHLAEPICSAEPDQVVAAAEAVVKLFRDHGNRSDRKRARIKYLVADWGVDRFREVLAGYLPFPVLPPRRLAVTGVDLHLGWHDQGDGRWFYGLSVMSGRIHDDGPVQLRTGLREIVSRFRPKLRLSANQDVLLCDIDPNRKAEFESLLDAHGIPRSERRVPLEQYAMACPAIPTCGLAITESERVLPTIVQELRAELRRHGLEDEAIGVRATGCPNGCARPYQSDIGVVGRSGSKYTLYVGGRHQGDVLNFELRDLVPVGDIVPTLRPVLAEFTRRRLPGEGFGDFCRRLGPDAVRALAANPATISANP